MNESGTIHHVGTWKGKRWVVLPEPQGVAGGVAELARGLRVPEVVARVLMNRGMVEVAAAEAFMAPRFRDLHEPGSLPNMKVAAGGIARAVRGGGKITLFGDYDVDGITGTAMLWHTLKTAGAKVEYYIPHRVEEGYGLSKEAVEGLIAGGTQLLVTVDCGCSAVGPIARARELGVEVVVTD